MVEVLEPEVESDIYDPTCGSGGMLIESKNYVESRYGSSNSLSFFGQEINGTTWSLCRMNMLFHNIYDSQILQGDTLVNPSHLAEDSANTLRSFDIVIANPPFSSNYKYKELEHKERFDFAMPEKKKADFMFVQHMISVLKPNGRMAVVMPHGVLFRGGEEQSMRKSIVDNGYLEAVIGLPSGLFYGTGIPASILIINRKDAHKRDSVLFINADREYQEGKNQNTLRPEDIAKISYVYRKKLDMPAYAKNVKHAEIADEDYNFNIRRYVDNSPPATANDVTAHLYGGVPSAEIEELAPFWVNYPNLSQQLFVPLKAGYQNFSDSLGDKQAIKPCIEVHTDILNKRQQYKSCVDTWWQTQLTQLEQLPVNKNIFELYRTFASSLAHDLSQLGILDIHKSRGAFAGYWKALETDLKSVSVSGWNAQLIPDDEILQSQFPDIITELQANIARQDELEALFNEVEEIEADEFNEEDYDILPKQEIKDYKEEVKTINKMIKDAKADIKALKADIKESEKSSHQAHSELAQKLADKEQLLSAMEANKAKINAKLDQHNVVADELKKCKATIKEIQAHRDQKVAEAREKISNDEAKLLILTRWKTTLDSTVMDYIYRYERQLITLLEEIYTKYEHTLTAILAKCQTATEQLDSFLQELGYE